MADGQIARRPRDADASSCFKPPTAGGRVDAAQQASSNGKDRTGTRFNTQLDEDVVPVADGRRAPPSPIPSLYANHIKPRCELRCEPWPCLRPVERWEEQDGYSPSTIAAEIAGLVAAADPRRRESRFLSRAAGSGAASPMTSSAPSRAGRSRPTAHSHRATSSASRRPGTPKPAAITYNVGNGGPTLGPAHGDRRRLSLELARLGELPAKRPGHSRVAPRRRRGRSARTRQAAPGWHRYKRRRLRRQRGATAGHGPPSGRSVPATSGPRCPPNAPEQSLADRRRAPAASVVCSTAWINSRAVSA